jgi:hypothetical protein
MGHPESSDAVGIDELDHGHLDPWNGASSCAEYDHTRSKFPYAFVQDTFPVRWWDEGEQYRHQRSRALGFETFQ